MDFELLSEKPAPPSLWDELERAIGNRRWNWQRWTQRPPRRLGLALFLAVVFEYVIAQRLTGDLAFDRSIWRQLIMTAGVILLIESALAVLVAQASELFGAEGKITALFAFFNLGLTPLLLIAPISLTLFAADASPSIRLLVLMALLAKVMLNWREAIEITYKFTKAQSAIVIYVASLLTFVALALAGYILLVRRLAEFFA